MVGHREPSSAISLHNELRLRADSKQHMEGDHRSNCAKNMADSAISIFHSIFTPPITSCLIQLSVIRVYIPAILSLSLSCAMR